MEDRHGQRCRLLSCDRFRRGARSERRFALPGSDRFGILVGAMVLLVLSSLIACPMRGRRSGTGAGVAIAIEMRRTAQEVARAVANQADPACGTYLDQGPLVANVAWTLTGEREGQTVFALEETRSLEVDEAGRARFRRQVSYRYAAGSSGERHREWRLIEGQLYVKDHNLPFERRPVDVVEQRTLLSGVREVFETLVRATGDGWTEVSRTDMGWNLASSMDSGPGYRIRCGGVADGDPWLAPLLERIRVIQASARIEYAPDGSRPRLRQGEWLLELLDSEEPRRLRIQVDEEILAGPLPEPIEPPTQVVDLRRDRLYRQLDDLLADVDALGWRQTSDDTDVSP